MLAKLKTQSLISLISILVVNSANSQESSNDDAWKGFDINGFHTIRFDHYDSSGPRLGSTLPFEGQDVYGEIGINFYKQDRPYVIWRGQIFGVGNANEYRSVDKGIVPERINVTREVGDTNIPYRYELGDYFSYFSNMTQQSSLKGAQFELQPQKDDRIDSFIFFVGANESRWQELTPEDDYSIGASYLVNHPTMGSWSFNSVFNSRDSESDLGLSGRDQLVSSISWFNEFPLSAHTLTFESEAAYFKGDHNGTITGSGEDKTGTGYFAELYGESNHLPWDYRFRAERYNNDFQPRSGIIIPDRRSLEAHTGWQFSSGISLKGRIQAFDDGFQSSNELETRTIGLNVNGPIFGNSYANASGNIDSFFQTQENEDDSIDQDLLNFSADVNIPLPNEWNGQVGVFTQLLNDKSTNNADSEIYQVSLSGIHDFKIAGFEGIITPGILVRLLRDSSPNSDDIQPTLAFNLNRDAHSIGFNYGYLSQDRDNPSTDIVTQTLGIDYRYQKNQNTFGAELIFNGRDPDPGAATDDWNLGIYWTHSFDWPARRKKPHIAPSRLDVAPAVFETIDVYNLSPGLPYPETLAQLEKLGLRDAYRRGNIQVWDTRLLQNILQRQRLAIAVDNNEITYSALIIDFENVGDVDNARRIFDRVQKTLIDTYGAPTSFYEEGEFTNNLRSAINRQELIRIFEWRTASGVVRFGIPRRLDSQVRMEVQHRRSFPQPRDTLWSIEEVR